MRAHDAADAAITIRDVIDTLIALGHRETVRRIDSGDVRHPTLMRHPTLVELDAIAALFDRVAAGELVIVEREEVG